MDPSEKSWGTPGGEEEGEGSYFYFFRRIPLKSPDPDK
jgi:hypothetical protein